VKSTGAWRLGSQNHENHDYSNVAAALSRVLKKGAASHRRLS
jgi:hypothetical protein